MEKIKKEGGDISEIMAKMKNSFDTAMEFYANKYGFGQDFCRAFYHVNDTSTPDLAKPFSGVREFCLLAKEKGTRIFLFHVPWVADIWL